MIKYVVHPGFILSRTDGDEHYITGRQLINLYRLPLGETYIWTGRDDKEFHIGMKLNEAKHFYPRWDGNYD